MNVKPPNDRPTSKASLWVLLEVVFLGIASAGAGTRTRMGMRADCVERTLPTGSGCELSAWPPTIFRLYLLFQRKHEVTHSSETWLANHSGLNEVDVPGTAKHEESRPKSPAAGALLKQPANYASASSYRHEHVGQTRWVSSAEEQRAIPS